VSTPGFSLLSVLKNLKLRPRCFSKTRVSQLDTLVALFPPSATLILPIFSTRLETPVLASQHTMTFLMTCLKE
jgi:hypothetical protein